MAKGSKEIAQVLTAEVMKESTEIAEVPKEILQGPKVILNMETGEIKAHGLVMVPASKYVSHPTEVKTNVRFSKGKAIKAVMFVSLTEEATRHKRLLICGPTQITKEGPVTLSLTNNGYEAAQFANGDIIGNFVIIKGEVEV